MSDSPPAENSPAAPAERLWRLWGEGRRPDVDVFLAGAGPLSPAELAAVLRVDQRERWRSGERVPAEDYLRRHPAMAADPEAAIDLIFNEFLLRERLGERPGPEEYLRRFPDYAGVLGPQIDLHRAMDPGAATASAPPPLTEPTVLQNDDPVAADEQPPPGQPVLALASRAQSGQDVQALLRKRLFFIAVVSASTFAVYTAIVVLFFLKPLTLSLHVLMLAMCVGLAGLLRSRRPLSLTHLRWIEALIMATSVLFVTLLQWMFYSWDWLSRVGDEDWLTWMVMARGLSLTWVIITIAYGLLIPNTWRRCAAVVGVVALWPVLFNAGLGLWDRPLTTRLMFGIEMGIDMAMAAAIAVYGSHRIEVLRRQALEARKVGPYRLNRRLGAGGMGEVYLAEHELLRRPCAVKLIRPDRASDPQSLRRFEREVRATATLSHPNTVEVFDYGHAEDGAFYYVMEYLPGFSLKELVERHGPLPPERAVHLLRQVCGALGEAHGVGLIHRDVKPANVLVCERGGVPDVAKLLDFGLVRAPGGAEGGETLTGEGMIAGTPAYMSPEQAAGGADLDARTDVYSLGAVAYFLLTGRPPFVRATAVQTLHAHLTEPAAAPQCPGAEVPPDLQAVVLRCLEKEPARRFPDVAALEQALAGCSCGGRWSRERAAAWWGEHGREAAPAETRPLSSS